MTAGVLEYVRAETGDMPNQHVRHLRGMLNLSVVVYAAVLDTLLLPSCTEERWGWSLFASMSATHINLCSSNVGHSSSTTHDNMWSHENEIRPTSTTRTRSEQQAIGEPHIEIHTLLNAHETTADDVSSSAVPLCTSKRKHGLAGEEAQCWSCDCKIPGYV